MLSGILCLAVEGLHSVPEEDGSVICIVYCELFESENEMHFIFFCPLHEFSKRYLKMSAGHSSPFNMTNEC